MSIKEAFKNLENDMNLTKKYPGYFKKNIFRSVVYIIIMLLLIILFTNNMSLKYTWIECDKEICVNPFRTCEAPNENTMAILSDCIEEPVPQRIIDLCGGPCPETLINGQTIGEKAPFIARNYNKIVVVIVGFAFWINHLLWIKRGRKK